MFQTMAMARILELRLASEEEETGEDMVNGFTMIFNSAPTTDNAWSPFFTQVFRRLEDIVKPDFDFYVVEGIRMFKFIVPCLSAEKFLLVIDLLSVLQDVWVIDWNCR